MAAFYDRKLIEAASTNDGDTGRVRLDKPGLYNLLLEAKYKVRLVVDHTQTTAQTDTKSGRVKRRGCKEACI